MVRVVPVKGVPFVVNRDHTLTVVHSTKNTVEDVAIPVYETWNAKRREKSKLQRAEGCCFEGPTRALPLDPYVLRTGFRLEHLEGEEDYFGFTLDGDGRYLLDDFTVTHNTGKTTCLKTALNTLRASGKTVLLMAPTGKAARRMEEACTYPASTIHRALAWMDGVFTHGRHYPLDADVIICDEASMLDTELAACLFNAIDERRMSIFLVGDVNQLPSVGPGRVLGDLIATGEVPTVRLETLHRAAQGCWVNRNAPRILAGDMDNIELGTAADFAFVRLGPENPDALMQLVEDEINQTMAITGALELPRVLEQMQVLIPMKRGPLGVHAVNAKLQEAFQGGTLTGGWKLPDETMLYDGDKVIQTKNDYQLGLMNGEQGVVAGIRGGKELIVDVNGESYTYSREQSRNLTLSYAITVHRSQGSEYPVVIVVCHSSHGRMLSRELIYTAVTRAKKRVVIAGDEEGLARAVANDRVQERQTGLLQAVCATAGG